MPSEFLKQANIITNIISRALREFAHDYPEIKFNYNLDLKPSEYLSYTVDFISRNKSPLASFEYSNNNVKISYPDKIKPSDKEQWNIVKDFIHKMTLQLLPQTQDVNPQTFFSAPSAATASSNDPQPQVQP